MQKIFYKLSRLLGNLKLERLLSLSLLSLSLSPSPSLYNVVIVSLNDQQAPQFLVISRTPI